MGFRSRRNLIVRQDAGDAECKLTRKRNVFGNLKLNLHSAQLPENFLNSSE